MVIIKFIVLTTILFCSSYIGIIISNKYKNRTIELKEMKRALNIFETKLRYTYEPVPEIFDEISRNTSQNIANIFREACTFMNKSTAKIAWEKSLEFVQTNMNKEDIEVVKGLGKLLGTTDVEGQVSQIQLTNTFLDEQIEKAQKEYIKNEKMYRTLRGGCWFSFSNYTYIKY